MIYIDTDRFEKPSDAGSTNPTVSGDNHRIFARSLLPAQ